MMPNAILASSIRTLHTDRLSSDLRRYARDEWRSQIHWIRAGAHPLSPRSRLRRWIARKRLRTALLPEAAERIPLPMPAATVGLDGGAPCLHPAREDLGLGGIALFLRCCLCGEVWVVSGSRAWGLAPADAIEAVEASCG